MKSRTCLHVLLFLLVYVPFVPLRGNPGLAADDDLLHLSIGDPEHRDRQVPLALDAITDSRTGELLTPSELPARLAGVDVLLVGESHTDVESHRVQHRIVDVLDRAGRKVMIGLEMFPYTHQQHLDRWVARLYSEDGFLELADWYTVWGYHWNYYRDLFLLARERGIPMFGVNTPREVITAVREKGFKDLTEDEAAHIPSEIDTDSDDHLRLFKAYFDEDDPIHSMMDEDAWKSMLRAQCTWDATMGYNAVRAFEALTDDGASEGAIMVVLAGSGHVAYGLGIERQAAKWFDGEVALLIPVPVTDDSGAPVADVQASYADYLWGLPEERAPIYPSLGISSRKDEDQRRKIIYVAEDSAAERAGFEVDDVLIEVDGQEIRRKGDLNRLMAQKRWGDSLSATVRRGEETVELVVLLRRTLEDEEEEGEEEEEPRV